ncbi:hypothetical protein A4X13_0g3777 [Tilletia indica]|uniref:Uncharacterized protein n=1 Tax=Tilletia indica TaxID=43049 RepID=A0A177T8K7_9BASI|nr:hypothetical protein A4X13_0g3777 [Tilletia indica]
MAQPHQQQPPSTASPSQIPVPVIPPPPPTPTPARHSASASTTTTTATRRASTSIHPASPARSRISTPSAASASSNAPPTITPTTTTATTAPPPLTSSAQLTAAQALAQQPTTTAHHTPSLFGGPSLFGSVLPQNQELNRAYGAVLPLNNNNNNPSTRILSSANISTPVPSSASSSATFLTGRSQPPQSQSIHAAATTAGAGRTASPFIRHNTTGSNTPSRIGQGSNITLMPGVPLPLSFNSTTGSPRIHSAQHHTGIYTAPHFYTSAVGAAASAAAVSAASAGSAGGGGGGPSTIGSRGSPTLRNMNMPGGAYPQAGGGIPTSPPSGLSGFPAWYRHPTSGLLPLLEVPSALLSAGSATATRSAPRTGSTSALLRSSAGLALHAGRPPSSSTNTTGATTTTQVPNPLHAGPIAGGAMAEDTLVSFSWVIGELALLRDEVERTMPPGDEGRSVSAGAGRNPVWTTQPCFGDPKLPKWKLELVRTQRNRTTSDEDYHPLDENVPSTSSTSSDAQQTPLHAQQDARSESGDSDDTPRPDATTVLSVYLTSLALEYLPSDALIPATIMLGLQPARTTLSRLQSRQGAWLWQTHSSFVFRREHEFFECHSLPSLSELLEMEEVRAQDALRLVVQIGCGPGIVGPETEGGDGFGFGFGGGAGAGAEGRGEMLPMPRLAPFQMPSAHYVSQTILDAMEGLVDCARTGDVRIIVRERGLLIRPPAVVAAGAATRSDDGQFEEGQGGQQAYVIPYPVGSYFPLDVAESAEQQAMAAAAAMEHSGVLPEDATTPTASVVVRDRIIWAHSSVLRARSQYFADMMDGGFAEAQDELDNDLHAHATSDPGTSRAIKTFRIPDSEWATVYWLIRYLYLEEIEFAEREDVRSAALDNEWQICAEGLYPEEGGGRGAGSQTRPNWEWRTISELLREEEEEDGDGGGEVGLGPEAQMHYSNTNTNVTSVDWAADAGVPSSSSGTKLAVPSSPSSSWRGHPGTIYSSSHPPPKNLEAQAQCHGQTSSSSSSSAGSSTLSSTHSEQHRLSVSSAASMHVGHDAFVAQSQPGGSGSGSAGAGGEGGPGMSSASTTPVPHHHHEQHHHQHPPSNIIRHASTMNDPHEHPAARAPPASALATYKLAHRYGQVGLAELAKVHIVETLSPQSAFPVLLATALYSGLHEAIKRYVYEHWDEVSHTEEFERCCDEVGAGEWGAEAGRSLRIFMQSLLSPARILLASPQR